MDMGNIQDTSHNPSIQHVTKFDEYKDLISSTSCAIKFTANWCGPCKTLAPVYQNLANEYGDKIRFLEVNIDMAREITNHENVKGIPLVLFYHNKTKYEDLSVKGGNSVALTKSVETFFSKVNRIKSIKYMASADDYSELINSSSCVVKFSATWCKPCTKISPTYHMLSIEHNDKINFIEVDIDERIDVAKYENIENIPAFVFYHEKNKMTDLSFSGSDPKILNTNMNNFLTAISPVVIEEIETSDHIEDSFDITKSDDNNEYGEDCEISGDVNANVEEIIH